MTKRVLLLVCGALCLASLFTVGWSARAAGGDGDGPAVGQAAPDFSLPWASAEGIHLKQDEWLKLSSLKGSAVILAFFPAAWSGGCTTEMCTFRDSWGDLAKLNAKLYGVSGDYVFTHQAWAKAEKFTFPFLQDHDHAVAKEYGSYMPQYQLDKRTVYLIDKDGVVRFKNLNFKAGSKEDYDALRAALVKLQSGESAAK
ncbi:MAG TPA: peroxiredoxin [Blastocatellia bacterium]|nr:peroxiredoxin [Blastocatellia bacterium]